MKDLMKKIDGKMTLSEFEKVLKRFKVYAMLKGIPYTFEAVNNGKELRVEFNQPTIGKTFYFNKGKEDSISLVIDCHTASPSQNTTNLNFEDMQSQLDDRVVYQKFFEFLYIEAVMLGYLSASDLVEEVGADDVRK